MVSFGSILGIGIPDQLKFSVWLLNMWKWHRFVLVSNVARNGLLGAIINDHVINVDGCLPGIVCKFASLEFEKKKEDLLFLKAVFNRTGLIAWLKLHSQKNTFLSLF